MYNKRLTPEQALLEIKLRMNYDLSKTLNENKEKLNLSSEIGITQLQKKTIVEQAVEELKTTAEIEKFHDWLDANHPGWHDKYKTLNGNKGRGYGKFGPRTKKWWDLVKDDFLAPDTKNSKGEEVPIETEREPEKSTQNTTKVDTTPPTAQVPEPAKDFQKLAQTQFGANSQSSNVETPTKPSRRVANADTEF